MYKKPYEETEITDSDITQALQSSSGQGNGLNVGTLKGKNSEELLKYSDTTGLASISTELIEPIIVKEGYIINTDGFLSVKFGPIKYNKNLHREEKHNWVRIQVLDGTNTQVYIRYIEYPFTEFHIAKLQPNTPYTLQFAITTKHYRYASGTISFTTPSDYRYLDEPYVVKYGGSRKLEISSLFPGFRLNTNNGISQGTDSWTKYYYTQVIIYDLDRDETHIDDLDKNGLRYYYVRKSLKPKTNYRLFFRYSPDGVNWSNYSYLSFKTADVDKKHRKIMNDIKYQYTRYLNYYNGESLNNIIVSVGGRQTDTTYNYLRTVIDKYTGKQERTTAGGILLNGYGVTSSKVGAGDDKAIFFGGANSNNLGTIVDSSMIVTNTSYQSISSSATGVYPHPVCFAAADRLTNGDVISVGGYNGTLGRADNDICLYDESLGTWTQWTVGLEDITGISNHAVQRIGNNMCIIFGGVVTGHDERPMTNGRAWLLQTNNRNIIELPPMEYALSDFGVCTIQDERIIVVGGLLNKGHGLGIYEGLVDYAVPSSTASGLVFDYDWRTGKMHIIDDVGGVRINPLVVAVDDSTVLVTGGGQTYDDYLVHVNHYIKLD